MGVRLDQFRESYRAPLPPPNRKSRTLKSAGLGSGSEVVLAGSNTLILPQV